jgi:DNA helicase-2/ATP-dependent DNA helicase PcrA
MDFKDVYTSLNDRQRQAVDQIDGPVLVIAGPGTGKTQLLSSRVANILLKTDTDPANIICLTFTVNAANNMRERLRKMIGTRANQVIIKTFHSLAADIITSNPEHFNSGAVLNPISELAAQQMVVKILDKLSHDNPLLSRFDDKYTHLPNILTAISKAKEAGLNPEKLSAHIIAHKKEIDEIEPCVVELFSKSLSHKTLVELLQSYEQYIKTTDSSLARGILKLLESSVEADIPSGKTTNTGKLKSKLLGTHNGKKIMVKERKANEWWQALTMVYEQYQAALYKKGYIDYSDMLIGVIDALENSNDLRLDIQEATQYVLIDEFQDSNEAQIKLMHLLVDNPVIDKPNIMVVGDPNQTIYGFNGAMLDNATDFRQFYANGITTIDLEKNYRSSQAILNISKSVITPYSAFHPDLQAENEPDKTRVKCVTFGSETDQSVIVCQNITEKILSKQNETVAVLARTHKSLAHLARYLMSTGLTVNYEQSIDIRDTPGNKLIIHTLALIQAITVGDSQESNFRLSEILRHPLFDIDPAITWHLALQSNSTTNWLDLASKRKDTQSIITWIQKLVSVAASQPLNVVIEQLLSLEYAPSLNLYKVIYENESAEKNVIEAQATRRLLEIAEQYTQVEQEDLRSFVNMLRETGNTLFMFSPNTGEYNNAVTLITVHGAKGLEFDHVYVIDCDESGWKVKSSRYPIPLSLPIHTNAETASDYARLLYVAMTRARKTLHMSYVEKTDSKTTALPAEQLAHLDFVQAKPAPIHLVAQSELSQLLPPASRPKSMQEILADTLNAYSLNATHLTHFLDVSRNNLDTFLEDNILKFPRPASDVLAHGNAMHAAMELAQIQTSNNTFNLQAIKRKYSQKLEKENLTSDVVEKLTNRAFRQIDALFGGLGLKFSDSGLPEQSYSAITPNGLHLSGKIDRIDMIDDKTIRIIDYKTGKPITTPQSKSKDILLKQWRHHIQLGFYILLIKQLRPFKDKTILARIIQLDATSQDHLYIDYTIDENELDQIEVIATKVYERIKSLDFPDTAHYSKDYAGVRQFITDLTRKSL